MSVLPADSEEFLTHWSSPVAYRYPKVDLRKYWTTVYPWVTLNFSSVGGKYQVGYSIVAMTLKFAVPNEPNAIRGNGKNPYHISKTIKVKQSTSTLPNPSLSNVSAESGNLRSFGVIKSGGAKRE